VFPDPNKPKKVGTFGWVFFDIEMVEGIFVELVIGMEWRRIKTKISF
jgi:hypothetical protein